MPSDPILQVHGVSFSYGPRLVLSEVDLSVWPGELVAVLGPSGCGKSTLLRLVAGLERLTEGSIALLGHVVAEVNGQLPPERRGLGLVFQEDALFPHMSVLDNVAFGIRGLSRGDRSARALDALDRLGLAHRAKAFPHQLSGGEQQRVAVARALAPRPALILMDEPFSRLDSDLRRQAREMVISTLREAGVGMVLVTHDAEEAMSSADRLVLIAGGRVLQTGTPEQCYRQPASLEAGRLLGPLNALPVTVSAFGAETPFGSVKVPGIEAGPGLLAFRPEDLVVSDEGAQAVVVARTYIGGGSRLRLGLVSTRAEVEMAWMGLPPAIGEALTISLVQDRAIVLQSARGESADPI